MSYNSDFTLQRSPTATCVSQRLNPELPYAS